MAYSPKAVFYEQHAEAAMLQQQMYGIPASITLAQMYLESAGGGSRLAREGNNYFGIKCPKGWVESGKPYGLHSDDRPNEKFCYYGSVEESIQHHSEFLMGKRYSKCQALKSTDYIGWANGLQECGYATAEHYAANLIDDIKKYRLDLYDKKAVENATQPIGYMRGKTSSAVAVKKTFSRDLEAEVKQDNEQPIGALGWCWKIFWVPTALVADVALIPIYPFYMLYRVCSGESVL